MEMKTVSSEVLDRLSELPDSLILNVFEFLPMKDIVKTQILSRRWGKLWTLTPYLYFDNLNSVDSDKFRNFVRRSLSRWRGEKIQKFKVRIHKFDSSLFRDMDSWVRFAVDHGVEELDTSYNFLCYDFPKEDYLVPKCLYSSTSLRTLSIFGSLTNINDCYGVQWKHLKILKLRCCWMTQHSIDQVLSGIPMLEDFALTFCTVKQKNNLTLSFRSTSLKKLQVVKSLKTISMDTELRIWTPNLETLKIFGGAYAGCFLMDVSSLTHATLSYNDLRLLQLLGARTSNDVLSPLSSVVHLHLNGGFEGYDQLVGFLEFFPKLETLVLGQDFDPKSKMNLKQNTSMSFLVELRNVQVTWNMRDFSIFPLIEILLNYASKLEKMVFRVKHTVPPSALLLASTKLLRMRRSSPTAELIFLSSV